MVMQDSDFTLDYMQGLSLRSLLLDSGYFHIWLSTSDKQRFFDDEVDQDFFLTQLQRLLSPRQSLQPAKHTHHFTIVIDLLAFSLTASGVHLVVYTSRRRLLHTFTHLLIARYTDFISQQPNRSHHLSNAMVLFDRLAGPHEALNSSRDIHLLQKDWRTTAYSSIRSYLDDVQPEWLRPQRLTSLFDNNPDYYQQFLFSRITERDRIFEFITT